MVVKEAIIAAERSGRLYLPQLDVMRFFAFLSVFFLHSLPSPNVGLHTGVGKVIALVESVIELSGESGVALFFLLSAYLITELLRREKVVSGSVHLRMFYIRRALRIWPLYYLAVAIGLVFSVKVARFHLAKADIMTYVFFLKNWDIAFRGWNWNPIFILWTVSAEEQFYLVWPFAQKMLTRRRLMGLCIAAIIVIPLVVFQPTGIFVRNHATQQIFTFLYFPIGSLIALHLDGRRKEAGAGCSLVLLSIGLGLWFAGSYLVGLSGESTRQSQVPLQILGRLLIIPGTISIFFAFFKSNARWSLRPLVYLGKISFGLYVFHATVLYLVEQFTYRMGLVVSTNITYVAVHLSLAMGLTIAAAALSYELYEKQFLRLKDRFAIVHSRSI